MLKDFRITALHVKAKLLQAALAALAVEHRLVNSQDERDPTVQAPSSLQITANVYFNVREFDCVDTIGFKQIPRI